MAGRKWNFEVGLVDGRTLLVKGLEWREVNDGSQQFGAGSDDEVTVEVAAGQWAYCRVLDRHSEVAGERG